MRTRSRLQPAIVANLAVFGVAIGMLAGYLLGEAYRYSSLTERHIRVSQHVGQAQVAMLHDVFTVRQFLDAAPAQQAAATTRHRQARAGLESRLAAIHPADLPAETVGAYVRFRAETQHYLAVSAPLGRAHLAGSHARPEPLRLAVAATVRAMGDLDKAMQTATDGYILSLQAHTRKTQHDLVTAILALVGFGVPLSAGITWCWLKAGELPERPRRTRPQPWQHLIPVEPYAVEAGISQAALGPRQAATSPPNVEQWRAVHWS